MTKPKPKPAATVLRHRRTPGHPSKLAGFKGGGGVQSERAISLRCMIRFLANFKFPELIDLVTLGESPLPQMDLARQKEEREWI